MPVFCSSRGHMHSWGHILRCCGFCFAVSTALILNLCAFALTRRPGRRKFHDLIHVFFGSLDIAFARVAIPFIVNDECLFIIAYFYAFGICEIHACFRATSTDT